MKIAIEGVEIYAYHGVYEEERKKGTQFVVDAYIETKEGVEGKLDDLSHTIDYSMVYELILKVMSNPVNLLETLVQTIGRKILESQPMAATVKVRVSKERPLAMEKCMRAYAEASFAQN